jgi:hypothetical protein
VREQHLRNQCAYKSAWHAVTAAGGVRGGELGGSLIGFRCLITTPLWAIALVGLPAGCGTQVKSNGQASTAARRIQTVDAWFDPVPLSTIVVKGDYGISESNKATARAAARKLFAPFQTDFTTRFPQQAAEAGLTVSRAATDHLRVRVTGADTSCAMMWGCFSFLDVRENSATPMGGWSGAPRLA